ncbi:MAG: nitroreductase/quinone reductase family protein [Actinomycetota bacterium]
MAGAPPRRPPPWLLEFLAPFVRAVLRSRLHRLLSAKLLLLTYTGRTSGRNHTIPIGYFRWDDETVVSFTSRRWWTNLRDGRPVRVLVRGRWGAAVPTVEETLDASVELLGELIRRHGPRVTRHLFLGLPRDRAPTPQELRRAAAGITAVTFHRAWG